MKPRTRFIYFDLGNVILHFDHHLACEQMSQLCGVPPSRIRELVFDSDLQTRYESGDVSTDEFFQFVCEESNSQSDIQDFCHAASAIFELNPQIVPIVTQLRMASQRIGILSNTCEAHWQYATANRYSILPHYFEQIVLSYEAGSMKPDRKIYDVAIKKAGVSPSEIFFTDDRPENVEGARECGIDAVLFESATQLTDDLLSRGVNVPL